MSKMQVKSTLAAALIAAIIATAASSLATATILNPQTAVGQAGTDLVMSLQLTVNATRQLFLAWGVPSNDSAWGKLASINASVSEVKTLTDQGRIDAAYARAKEIMEELHRLIIQVQERLSVRETVKYQANLSDLMIKAQALNASAHKLLEAIQFAKERNLITESEAANLTATVEVQIGILVNITVTIQVALEKNVTVNFTVIKERLVNVEKTLENVRERINQKVAEKVKDEMKEKVHDMIRDIQITVNKLKEEAMELRQMGDPYTAQKIEAIAENLTKALVEVQNNITVIVEAGDYVEVLKTLSVYVEIAHGLKSAADEDYHVTEVMVSVTHNITELRHRVEQAEQLVQEIENLTMQCLTICNVSGMGFEGGSEGHGSSSSAPEIPCDEIINATKMLKEMVMNMSNYTNAIMKANAEWDEECMANHTHGVRTKATNTETVAEQLKEMIMQICGQLNPQMAQQINVKIEQLVHIMNEIRVMVNATEVNVTKTHEHIKIVESEKLKEAIEKAVDTIRKIETHVQTMNCTATIEVIAELETSVQVLQQAKASLEAGNITEALTYVNTSITHLKEAKIMVEAGCGGSLVSVEISAVIQILHMVTHSTEAAIGN